MTSSAALLPICVVEEGFVRVVKRFGRINRTLSAGVNVVTPYVDRFVGVEWHFRAGGDGSSRVVGLDLPLTRLIFDPDNLQCTTRDQLQVGVDLITEFRLVDPVRAVTTVHGNLFAAVETLLLTTLYDAVRGLALSELAPRAVQQSVENAMREACGEYGVELVRVLVENISMPAVIAEATIATESARRRQLAELAKLEQENKVALSQARLRLETLKAEQLEETVALEHEAKKRRLEVEIEVAADSQRLAQELKRRRSSLALESERLTARLAALRESRLSDAVQQALLSAEALHALAQSRTADGGGGALVLAPLDALAGMRVHLNAPVGGRNPQQQQQQQQQ